MPEPLRQLAGKTPIEIVSRMPQTAAAPGQGPGLQWTNLACPVCDMDNRMKNLPPVPEHSLGRRPGSFEYVCKAGHTFKDDSMVGIARKIEMKFQPLHAPPSNRPSVPVTFPLPIDVRDKLTLRFAGCLNESLAQALGALAEDGAFIVTAGDAATINEKAEQKIANQQALLGWVVAVVQTVKDANKAAELAQAEVNAVKDAVIKNMAMPAALQPGGLNLSVALMEKLREKAAAQEIPLDTYLENTLVFAIENQWI